MKKYYFKVGDRIIQIYRSILYKGEVTHIELHPHMSYYVVRIRWDDIRKDTFDLYWNPDEIILDTQYIRKEKLNILLPNG